MNCPNCNLELVKTDFRGIEVEQCPSCEGKWFEAGEIDQLEDIVFADDEGKNTLVTNVVKSDKKCPKCGIVMNKFNYRWEDLELEMCANKDGFWLDKNEEERIVKLMEGYKADLETSGKNEEHWEKHLRAFQSPTWVNKLREMFNA